MFLLYSVTNLDRDKELASSIAVAGSSEARRQGLLLTQPLATGCGLWIAPCEAVHTFGMSYPIDVVFLDRGHCVRRLVRALRPRRLSFCISADSVLELAPGSIDESGTVLGDRLRFQKVAAH